MCGLIAFFRHTDGVAAERALAAVSHRGLPGRTRMSGVNGGAIGHARLPIVGLGVEHDQPIRREGFLFGFVGEVHNYLELDQDARCDTDVAMLYLCFQGEMRVERLRILDGFWSIAAIDERRRIGLIATDHLGIKPLYWRPDALAAASEPQALTHLGPTTLDRVYLSNVLKWGYDPTGRTPYEQIHRVPPGTAVEIDMRTGAWTERFYFPLEPLSSSEPLAQIVQRAVARRVVADVPVALLLSGGLDSTIVLACLAKIGARVTAFHVENDEAEHAELAAKTFGVPLRALALDSVRTDDALEAFGEPVDLGSLVPQLALARAIEREGFRVAISGDGADELFGGYRRATQYDSQASDVFCELPAYHLPRLDRVMMRHRVELRAPFLAPEVVRAALALPWGRRTSKQALKTAFLGAIPSTILERAKKPLRSSDPTDVARRIALVELFVGHAAAQGIK